MSLRSLFHRVSRIPFRAGSVRMASLGLAACVLIPVAIDQAIGWSVKVHTDAGQIEAHEVGLVLGTSPTTSNRSNRYYEFRLDAAAELYHQGKVDALLVSGDHGRPEYNEPDPMKRDLIQRGVPAEHITCDYAGFRTLDSVVRAREVFGLQRVVIISQPFHAERAVFLARRHGLDATAFGAQNPSRRSLAKMRMREVLARNLAVWDACVGTQPKFGGPPIAVVRRPR